MTDFSFVSFDSTFRYFQRKVLVLREEDFVVIAARFFQVLCLKFVVVPLLSSSMRKSKPASTT